MTSGAGTGAGGSNSGGTGATTAVTGSGGAGGAGVSASSSSGGPPAKSVDCSPKALTTALAAAKTGDVLALGVCTLTGAFTVPAGVTLQGAGAGKTILVAGKGQTALTLTPSALTSGATTTLTDVDIQSDAVAGILGKGKGRVEIDRVNVTITHGIGVGLEGLDGVRSDTLAVKGPVTAAVAKALPAIVTPKDTGTHGLVLVSVGDAQLSKVQVSALGDYGALFVNSGVTWNGGSASDNLGTGLFAIGAKVTLSGVQLCRSFQGNRKLLPFGAVFAKGAGVTSTSLTVCDNASIGVLHLGVSANHTDFNGTGNGAAALWAQGATSFSIGGKSKLDGNHLTGLVILDSTNVTIQGASFTNTLSATLPLGDQSAMVQVGDGAHLVRTTGIRFQDVTISGNARSGLQVDLGAVSYALADLKWINVTADAAGKAFGALCQGSYGGMDQLALNAQANGWDVGITRTGAAVANDAQASSLEATVGVIDPNDIPSPDLVVKGGLAALTGP
jgi:hypothetical protein